jgi:hypothetical protein
VISGITSPENLVLGLVVTSIVSYLHVSDTLGCSGNWNT